MRILVTNDDGINAPGLRILEEIAMEIAGAKGEVWVVAPATEQSGVAHCITFTKPMMISKISKRKFSVDGSPADCVLAGIYDVMKENKPELILSGINRGNNSAENALYSGTIGAAIEGTIHKIKSIALSQYLGPNNLTIENPFEAAGKNGVSVIQKLLKYGEWGTGDYRLFYNVNFPPERWKDVKGSKISSQGFRKDTSFGIEPHVSPSGRKFLRIKGRPQNIPTAENTDVAANLDGYISITPMKTDLTDHQTLNRLQNMFETNDT